MSASILVLDHPYFTIPAVGRRVRAAQHSRRPLHARRLARTRRRTDADRARRGGPDSHGEPDGARRGPAVSARPRPPRLLVKTLAVTFATVAVLLIGRLRPRDGERSRSGPAVRFDEPRGRPAGVCRDRSPQAARAQRAGGGAGRKPALKAAVDTYAAESRSHTDPAVREQWLNHDREAARGSGGAHRLGCDRAHRRPPQDAGGRGPAGGSLAARPRVTHRRRRGRIALTA